MAQSKSDFQYISINTMRTPSGEMYQARLPRTMGRKTVGLGSHRIQALNIALILDEEICRILSANEDIDIDALRQIARNEINKYHSKQREKIRIVQKDSLVAIWDKYVNFHKSLQLWTDTYLLTHIQTVSSLIEKCPHQKLEEKTDIVTWFFSDTSRNAKTSKDRFKLVVASIDWASKQGIVPRKFGIEYRDLLETIKIDTSSNSRKNDDDEIDIFRLVEINSLLDAFKNDTYSRFKGKHSQYYAYTKFLWLTGCRPSEAIALKWHNIDFNKRRIKFCEGEVLASGKRIKKEGTKTKPVRYFPINEDLRQLLNEIPHRQGYVFLTDKDKPICQHTYSRVFERVLASLGLRKRVPYQLRHSMISYHANNDFPLHKLAELVGNSEDVIKEHYLHIDVERISLPTIQD